MTTTTHALTVTAAQAAEMLGCSADAIYTAVRQGELPNVGFGRKISIPRHAVEARFAAAGAPLPRAPRIETVDAGTFT